VSVGARILKWQILRAYAAPPEFWKLLLLEPWTNPSGWTFIGSFWPNYDTTDYISSPSSLCGRMTLGNRVYGDSMLTGYPCIPEIRIVNNVKWMYSASEGHYNWFRAQAMPPWPTIYPMNCYFLRFYNTAVVFGYFLNGGVNTIANYNFSPALNLGQWYKYRFSMWDYPSHANPLQVAYQFDLWETDHWTTYLSGVTSSQLWSGSAVNYYGNFLNNSGHYNMLGFKQDDTEIWIPNT
jgi:hypothetical protein